jgi:hypothetical protein
VSVQTQPPVNLTVSPLPQGSCLKTSWEYSGTAVTGYNLYRSTSSGGPYSKIANSPNLSFTDSGVTDDITYYYVVTAVDAIGNESSYSNEAWVFLHMISLSGLIYFRPADSPPFFIKKTELPVKLTRRGRGLYKTGFKGRPQMARIYQSLTCRQTVKCLVSDGINSYVINGPLA